MIRLEKILVPVDFSPPSEGALHYALPIAERFGAKISLLHVVESSHYVDQGASAHDQHGALRNAAALRLTFMSEQILPPDLTGELLTKIGNPPHEIVMAATAENYDLIVISSHGYTGVKHLILGSTAERVVREAPCPVLVVRRSPDLPLI